jgi:hypothetical protein
MSAGLMKISRKGSARARGQLGPLVRDRHEMIGPSRHVRLQDAAEMRRERVRFDSRARLTREDVQGALRRSRCRENGGGIGRVEHLQMQPSGRDAQDRAQHFGREARSAHSEQHGVCEAVAPDAIGERLKPRKSFRHQRRGGHPSEAVRDLLLRGHVAGPDRRLVPPEAGGGALSHRAVRAGQLCERRGRELEAVLKTRTPGRDVERRPAREQVVRAEHVCRIL